ncbi:LOW QUALITY PROTEIN: phosphatidylinositolglycan class N [Endogone sp. FLAS-F59071]|nr:LOW QUALITY PROTEIN: phosphatidylinositolglycan class N [Endogone sp. FLAS-F59071]|eukprot:RUS15550.1 LOW QUALITY PROTEIN: phosphatidylinositolglycan class N [Endogone sp. FLAS-F59071]
MALTATSPSSSSSSSSSSSRNVLLLIGVIFHLIYILSIFDIYFKSPLVHGMTPHRVELSPPADRLFLFVADGLRADKLYQLYEEGGQFVTKAPFLRDIVLHHGTWGVSHTRVPTESRPGHVAIIAGFYEDVSAVTTGPYWMGKWVAFGWTMNPVTFDSVFNQSEHTWSFGSPDILPMFQHGASDPSRVETFMYGAHEEDFSSGKDATALDTFVFDHVDALFRNASHNPNLAARLRRPGVIFFLHLLGLDTNGHIFRPHSREYVENIAYIDKGIREVVNLVEKFYNNDGRTSYVFTADHGMNNRGAHGDGHPDNTRTPLIAWGAGIRKPNNTHPTGHDDFSGDWGLGEVQRNDVKQADIAPLMASLVGLNYPLNSVGELPLVYLENIPLFKAQASFVNAKGILAQYQVKYDSKQRTELFFQPFAPLSNATHSPSILVSRVQSLIDTARYDEAEELCLALIDLSLRGLRYLQTYDWLFLRGIVSAGYVGWMLYSLNHVVGTYVLVGEAAAEGFDYRVWLVLCDLFECFPPLIPQNISPITLYQPNKFHHPFSLQINLLAATTLSTLFTMLYVQEMPPMYYVYCTFPVFFWSEVLKRGGALLVVVKTGLARNWLGSVGLVVGVVAGLELLVELESFSSSTSGFQLFSPRSSLRVLCSRCDVATVYTRAGSLARRCLTDSVGSLLSLHQRVHVTTCREGRGHPTGVGILRIAWVGHGRSICCGDDLGLAGGALILATGGWTLWNSERFFILHRSVKDKTVTNMQEVANARSVITFQLVMVATSVVLVYDTTRSLREKTGLPVVNQIVSWIVLVVSSSIPFIYGLRSNHHFLQRLTVIFLAFAPTMILLSLSYETLFYYFFCASILLWMLIERTLYAVEGPHPNASPRALRPRDARTALIFLFFINVAFFGTGNIASVSGFQLESVYRLTTAFNPFFMGGLIVAKVLVPFLAVSAVLGVLARALDLPPFALFLVVLSVTDVQTLNFFYLVRDDGSWLEIGTSISHFCISEGFLVLSILLFLVSHLLVGRAAVTRVGEGIEASEVEELVDRKGKEEIVEGTLDTREGSRRRKGKATSS